MEKHLLTPPSAMTYPYSPANSMTWESPSQMVPSPYQMTTSPYPMVPSPSQMSNSSPSPLPMYSPSQTSLSTFETDFMMKQESPLSPYDMSYTIAASPNLVLNRNNNYNESKDNLNNTTVLTKTNSPTYFVTPPQSPPDNILMNASQNMNADFEISNEYNKISAAFQNKDMKQMDHDLVSEFDSFFQQYVQVHSKSQIDTMNQCLINALNKPQVIKTENDSQLFAPLMDPKLENIQTQSSIEELVLQQITNNQISSQPIARQTSAYGNEEENEITTKLHNCIEHLVKNNNLLSHEIVPIESTVVVARVDRNPYNWGPTEIHEWARHAMVIWAVPKGSVPIDRFTNGQVLMAASREQFVSLGVPEKFIEAILALREWYKHQYRPSSNSVGGQNFEIKMEVEDVNLDQKADVCNMIPLSVANHNQSNTGNNRNESNITDDHANQFINEMISDLAKCSNQTSNHVQTNVNDHSAINSFTNQNNIVVKYELDDTSLNTESSHNLNNDIRSSFYMGENQSISKFGINSSTDPSFFSFNHTADATEKKEADEVPPNVPGTNGPGGRSHIQLWQFLKELLAHPSRYGSYIRWVNRDDAIFKIEDSVKVATLWGERKNRPHMNYDKLSRSIRQYYNKNIMKKTSRAQRLVYQFCKDYGA